MSRLSKKYILITQPNHFSLFGKFLTFFHRHCEVYEYSYTIDDFIKVFRRYSMKLVLIKSYNFNEQVALLFEKF